MIAETHPKEEDCQQDKHQNSDLVGSNRKHITDEVSVVFRKAGTTQCGDKNTQSNCSAGKNSDLSVSSMIAAASDKRECQRKNNGD